MMLSGLVGMVGFHARVAVLVVEPLNWDESRVRCGGQGRGSAEDANKQ
jgi:hypothetical protein